MTPPIHQALQFLQQNRPADALKTLETLSHQSASDPNIDFLLGIALSMLDRKAEAVAVYERVIARNPKHAGAHLNMGADLYSLGDYEASLKHLAQAQSLEPRNPMVRLNIGNAHKAMGNLDAALSAYELALSLEPNYADAWCNRGDVLCLLGRSQEAIVAYEKALAIQPAFPDALNNLGLTHIEAKRFDAGIAFLKRALAIYPGFAMAQNNLGIALFRKGLLQDALVAYERAITLDNRLPDPYFNLAEALSSTQQYEQAIGCYQKAVERSGTPEAYLGTLLHIQMKVCDWKCFFTNTAALLRAIDAKAPALSPFTILGISSTANQQKRCAEAFVQKVYPSPPDLVLPIVKPKTAANQKIRIGYVSSDMYAHATAFLMAELFELHDRTRFEVSVFSYGRAPDDAMRERIKSAVDHFYDVADHSDPDAADLIRNQGIDILVDLKGHTEGARLGILAQRPSPIQLHYLGYPGTLGAPFIDYLIADNVLIKEEDYPYYSEKIVHLPGSYQVNDRNRQIATLTDNRQAHGLPENGFVYCCFNNNWKITPDIFDVWMRLLSKQANRVLWLIEDNPLAAQNLKKEAAVRGINPSRPIFAPKMPLDAHLSRHQYADLFLDTRYYNAHTTASDALWTGLPVLSLHGATYASRVGESLLSALNLASLVAKDIEAYEHTADSLASHPDQLSAIRQQLIEAKSKAALFDTPCFVKGLENAYEQMMDRAQENLAPDHIHVSLSD